MTVASVDYPNARIYLDSTTITGAPFDTLDIYRDVRDLRATSEDHRKYPPIIIAGGGIPKTSTTATMPYVQLLRGCRIVPYNASHRLLVVRETFTDDGLEGAECFDHTPLSPTVNVGIDYAPDKVEVRTVYIGGSALTTVEHNHLMSLLPRTLEADEREKLMLLPVATLESDERAALLAIDSTVESVDLALSQLADSSLSKSDFVKILLKRQNTIVGNKITRYIAGDDIAVDVTYNANGVPTKEDIDDN